MNAGSWPAIIGSMEAPVGGWAELTESRVIEIKQAIEQRLTDEGRVRLPAMLRVLEARGNQNPAVIHCLKRLCLAPTRSSCTRSGLFAQ